MTSPQRQSREGAGGQRRQSPGSRGRPNPTPSAGRPGLSLWKGHRAARATESEAYAEFGSSRGENPHFMVVARRPGRRPSARAFCSGWGARAAERGVLVGRGRGPPNEGLGGGAGSALPQVSAA